MVTVDSDKGRFKQGCSMADFVAVFGARLVGIVINGQEDIGGEKCAFLSLPPPQWGRGSRDN